MEVASREALDRWLRERKWILNKNRLSADTNLSAYEHVITDCVGAPRVVMLSRAIARGFLTTAPSDDAAEFQGGVAWITEMGIWNEASEELGCLLFSQVLGIPTQRPTSVVLSFAGNDLLTSHAVFFIALCFGWGISVCHSGGTRACEITHDGAVRFLFKDPQEMRTFAEWLQPAL
jgi:hypothetical protein